MNSSVQSLKDLLVLTADTDMQVTMNSLLARPEILQIRHITFDVSRHPGRDPGCRSHAVNWLRSGINRYRHALVMFDWHGCGSSKDRRQIQSEVESELYRNGWQDRAKAIVIDPELEAWVWNPAGTTVEVLGWSGTYRDLKDWLTQHGLWDASATKPADPKEAMLETLKKNKVRRSSTIFQKLASSIDQLNLCKDDAFVELNNTLRKWFSD